MIEEYQNQITEVAREVIGKDISVELTRPEEEFGDFSTNVAMKAAGMIGTNPRDLASKIAEAIEKVQGVASTEVAGPGFINIRLDDSEVFKSALAATDKIPKPLRNQEVVAEYSDPNPFKVLHAGHLYTSLVGDAVANLIETAGANVHRVNFGGDVGLHVAKTMWAIVEELGGEHPKKLDAIAHAERTKWLSDRYVIGNEAYASDDKIKQAIDLLNKKIYEVHSKEDKTSGFAKIYWTCRQWSYDGFDELYDRLGMVPFQKYYPESSVSDLGLKTVKAHIGKVYEESDGAVIFRGEKYGLFTQVFINSEGLPTYAGKDVGLIQHKFEDFHYDSSFIITDVAQKDHLAVVMKSVEQYEPELVKRTIHHTHGRIKFADGRKMSSREGNVVTASDVLDATFAAADTKDDQVVLGAVRYSFLKNKIGGDISYDPDSSVSLEGNSGPYIQYALVRARSILGKSTDKKATSAEHLDSAERSLARAVSQYPEAFALALSSYSPHHICSYLYDLSQIFNRFYEKSRVIDDPRSKERLALVEAYEKVLAAGLHVLGMPTPEKM